jgi:elongation factor G
MAAAAGGLKQALGAAQPVLLEPFMSVVIGVRVDFVGEVIGLLGPRAARSKMFDGAGRRASRP